MSMSDKLNSLGASRIGSPSKGERQHCFKAVNGIVRVSLGENCEYIFRLHDGVKICEAKTHPIEGFIHTLCGQDYNYLVEHIYTHVFTDELKIARKATCVYCKQLDAAIERGDEYVETLFGLRHISYPKKKVPVEEVQETPEDVDEYLSM